MNMNATTLHSSQGCRLRDEPSGGLGRWRGAALSNRQRFLNACHCLPIDHPPVWLMRQAGRCLPEYRALKEKHSFLKLIQTPELAAEVTLQPIRRFDFDAAIVFSDILVVSEALGQPFSFRDGGGVQMKFVLRSGRDIERLNVDGMIERLQYVAQTIPMIQKALGGRTALLGFAGSPWTLANFMLEGGSAREFTAAKTLFYSDRRLFIRLMEKLTSAVTEFLRMQIDAGVDAVQIFDSLGGNLAHNVFDEASGHWMTRVVSSAKDRVPVIVFSKGTNGNWEALAKTGAHVLSVDWTVRLADIRARLPPPIALQGNLDPALLNTTPEVVEAQVRRILEEMRGQDGHIFNLGHGVPPSAKLENIQSLVTTVRSFL